MSTAKITAAQNVKSRFKSRYKEHRKKWQWRDPHLQLKGVRGGGGVLKKFSALRASVWSKNKGGAGIRAPPLDAPLLEETRMDKLEDECNGLQLSLFFLKKLSA